MSRDVAWTFRYCTILLLRLLLINQFQLIAVLKVRIENFTQTVLLVHAENAWADKWSWVLNVNGELTPISLLGIGDNSPLTMRAHD
ncbi:hypothetical protein STEG23_000620 [Scotinomys teguina]